MRRESSCFVGGIFIVFDCEGLSGGLWVDG